MTFECRIDLDNAAFEDPLGGLSLAHLLNIVADGLPHDLADVEPGCRTALFDTNGNRVGSWVVLRVARRPA